MKSRYHTLCRALGYQFQQVHYLNTALTHRSAGVVNNERLEFLGDALLGYIVAELLYQRFPQATEGELTRTRAALVKRETLASIAQDIDLGQYLQLGSGELKSGGWRRASILADALEATIGAIYLDADIDTCRQVVVNLLQSRIESLSPDNLLVKDPKTRLQEYLQARQLTVPTYVVLDIKGMPPHQTFRVECRVDCLGHVAQAIGDNRRYAEQNAAEQVLTTLQQQDMRSHG